MTAKLLFVGDMHLGRAPARIPETLSAFGVTPRACGPAAALEAVVDLAVERRPDAVIFAGDLVESTNARFEAYAHLLRAAQRLSGAGVMVAGVAGNHDDEALPRLARALDDFRLLGADGGWSHLTVSHGGKPIVHVAGRSFVAGKTSGPLPVDAFPASPDDRPVIGVAHCDLDAGESPYAPVTRAALDAAPAAAWLLGHIHKPSLAVGDPRPTGYLGSLVGLDPTETGPRGPWWVEVAPEGSISLTHLPLARLRWESFDLPIALEANAADLLAHLKRRIHALRNEAPDAWAAVRALGCRIRVTGRARDHRAVSEEIADFARGGHAIPVDECTAFVDRLVDDVAPALDLAALAAGNDPPALLARDLVALEADDTHARALIASARRALNETAGRNAFHGCGDWNDDDDGIRDRLLRTGRRALESLLAEHRSEDGER